MRRRDIVQAAIALPVAGRAAQSRPVVEQLRIIHGFPAGGNADIAARHLAERLRGRYADVVVVESRTGAGGRIAAQEVKKAAADGTTLLLSPMSAMAIYPYVYKKLGYDPQRDFAPVSLGAKFELGLAVGAQVPDWVVSMERFFTWVRLDSEKAAFGSPGAGTSPHFLGVQLSQISGVSMQNVPYRGSMPGVMGLIGGDVPLMITALGDLLPHVASGKLRVLATSGTNRSPFAPQVPTLAESGYPTVSVVEWLGLFAPARTPRARVVLASESLRGAAGAEMRAALAPSGLEPITSTPELLATWLQDDLRRWEPVIRQSGFTADS